MYLCTTNNNTKTQTSMYTIIYANTKREFAHEHLFTTIQGARVYLESLGFCETDIVFFNHTTKVYQVGANVAALTKVTRTKNDFD